MALKAKHAFGSSSGIQAALDAKKIDSFDILFLDGDTDSPKIGWVDKNGKVVLVKDEKADLTELEADVAELETELATKANKAYVDGKVEAAVSEHLAKMYEVADVPAGTLVNYSDDEIRVMCPANTVFTKQSVGAGGDANSYYMTFKTFVPNENVVGYIEHLNGQSDSEVLTNFSVDEYGRRYQPTWLALAKYDETTNAWNYYGASSSKNKYIGWDYQIDWYNADGVMIASDSVRINLSNEDCHSEIKPYYVGVIEKQIEEKIAEINSAYEVIEF